jgi:ketosteroid isomerase-like protein
LDRQVLEGHVARIYEVFASGDLAAYRELFADDLVWHVPGNNPVSGAYRGPDEYFGTMVERMGPLDEWSFELTDVVTNEKDNAALTTVHIKGQRKGKRIDMAGHHMIRLNKDGKVVEGWGFVERQNTLDDFFS